MVAIFDRIINIQNNSKKGFEDVTEEKLEILDKMLNEYGIAHAFCLATAEEIDKMYEKNPDIEYCCSLEYEEKDEITLELVYMLWTKLHRGASDEAIRKAFAKKAMYENERVA